MTSAVRSRVSAYAIAVGLTLLAFLLTLLLGYFIHRAVFILFFPAVILSAWAGGLGPGLVATALSALAATYSSFQSPALFTAGGWDDVFLLGLFILVAGLISSLQAARRRAEEWFQVTLTCIGDAVVVTDLEGRVIVMNAEAERLIDDSAAPIHDRYGRLCGVVLVFRDITERKQA